MQIHRAATTTTTDSYASRYFARFAAVAAARTVVPDANLRVTHLPWAHAYLVQFEGVTVDEKLLRAIQFQFSRFTKEGFVAESGRMAWAQATSGQLGQLTTELVAAANDPAFDTVLLGGVPILFQAHEPVPQRSTVNCALEPHLGGFAVVYPSRTGPTNLSLRDVKRLTQVALERQALMEQALGLRSVGAINSVVAAGKAGPVIDVCEAWHMQQCESIVRQLEARGPEASARIRGSIRSTRAITVPAEYP